ncbi:MAG TPA: MFS transporter [Bryobacteraceae bacterium]|nr:MFS transporter [Bryobacteraceae bacterium]
MASRLRWLVLSIFVLSTALNYLDRLLLAALAPTLKSEFHLSNTQYGGVISVFSIVYALAAPVAGWFIDRVGLNAGITVSMAVWSLAGMATGLTRSFGGLLASRTVLGIGEAAGIPCAGKANGVYLQARELAFGTALNQVGITMGSIAAPLMVAAMAPVYGWRSVFVVCGALGFVWIPVWWATTRRFPAKPIERPAASGGVANILRDRRMWGLAAANALVMTLYTLWTNWTTVYFVEQHQLTEIQANQQFAWIPPVFATLGGFAGGWMAFRLIQGGGAAADALRARLRICWLAAAVLLLTAAVPLMPTPALAAALISFSFFWCLAISTNLYAIPIDLFGAGHAAFAVSILTASYGLMQTVLSPLIGSMVDHFGFAVVCVSLSVMPLAGIGILRASAR